jgi:sugar phosphate isomerase/epimerase
MTPISLAHLTVLDMPPPQMIHMAAELGYDRVGLRLIGVTDTTPSYALHENPAALRETIAALDVTGITVNDIEFVRLTPDFRAEALLPFLYAGMALGARHIICAPYDPDVARLADNLAALQSLARPLGLSCVLEFFPWTNVPSLAAARAVVETTADPDIGILIDTLHFDRSASTLTELTSLPASRLPFLHLCDAPVHPPYTTQDLLHAGRAERLPPGHGQIDLLSILARLPPDLPISLEVPMSRLMAQKGSKFVAALARDATLGLLASLAKGRFH